MFSTLGDLALVVGQSARPLPHAPLCTRSSDVLSSCPDKRTPASHCHSQALAHSSAQLPYSLVRSTKRHHCFPNGSSRTLLVHLLHSPMLPSFTQANCPCVKANFTPCAPRGEARALTLIHDERANLGTWGQCSRRRRAREDERRRTH